MRQIFVRGAAAFHRVFPEFAVFVRSARIGEDHGECDFAVAEVVANAFAHGRGVGRIIDGVVDQLKRDAEIAAISIKRGLDRRAVFRRVQDRRCRRRTR